AELFMNDIKGIDAPSLDAWSTAAALAAVTERLELMVAVRPTFHNPAILAKQAANIDQISNGRLSLNVVSSWWKDEARRYGIAFDEHDDRYARTAEWLSVIDAAWREPKTTFKGTYYQVDDLVVEPKPVASRTRPRPVIYAGGESAKAKEVISRQCDAYVMHGDPPERIAPKIADLSARRDALGLPPMTFGVAAYAIVRDTDAGGQRHHVGVPHTQIPESHLGRKPEPEKRLRFMERVRATMVGRRLKPRTITAYAHWIRRYIRYHDRRHPIDLGEEHVRAFLNHL